MTSKLIHITDLDGRDMYFLMIDTGTELRQQEINRHEYQELKMAENGHYKNELAKIKDKYRIIDEEKFNL